MLAEMQETNVLLPAQKIVPMKEGLTFLEQLTALSGQCSVFNTQFIERIDHENKQVEYAALPCKQWKCEACSVHNARQWIARIIDGCNKLKAENWYFATITAHKWWRGNKSLINLRRNWPKLRKRLTRATRKAGEPLFYCRNWEMHKDASFHMHLITNAPITERWLKDNASECGLGFQASFDKF